MILSPWEDPVPLKRAWCLWELYSTHTTGSKFEIAFSLNEEAKFFEDMEKDVIGYINGMRSKVDVARSECYFPADKEKIFTAIRQTTNFGTLNQIVFEKLRTWMISYVRTRVESLYGTNSETESQDRPRQIKFLEAQLLLARLYQANEEIEKAKTRYLECVDGSKRLLGDMHELTLMALHGLGSIYHQLGAYETAKAVYEECLERRKRLKGNDHADTLATSSVLATLYCRLMPFKTAKVENEKCYEQLAAKYGPSDERVLTKAYNIACLQLENDHFVDALSKFESRGGCRSG
jgi:tetratricopeptide (TPR) repeat protein